MIHKAIVLNDFLLEIEKIPAYVSFVVSHPKQYLVCFANVRKLNQFYSP